MTKPAPKSANPAPAAAPPANAPAPAPAFAFAIEKGIPLPTRRVGVKSETAYPFAHIGITESFFVPPTERMREPWKTLTSLASKMGRELHPKRFTTARAVVNGQEGVRVWRVNDAEGELAPPKVINRKSKAAKEAEAAALAKEAAEGDTSQRQHPTPDFDTPPPPAPPAPPAA